ncbi:retron St85 family RNA-directed DNA polymerase [Rugamonas sp. A1-17]|nr:retron St85 family RNA-directed DNA polymerase [Rugamonas sp. A1-17]
MSTIFEFVRETLLMDEQELLTFSQTAPHRYKKYNIKKRNGTGFRQIAQPSKEVKFIQRVILSQLKQSLTVHPCAMAYEPGTGIKLNALHHKDNSYLLKMDFRDFFPSITPFLFFSIAKDFDITFEEVDRDFLSRLLFYKSTRKSKLRLSIGAPTSPFISNFVMHCFDKAMHEYCSTHKINYTRYADDITFSANEKGILFDLPTLVKGNLRATTYSQIKINPDKTVYSSRAFNRHVTGVVITNDGSLSLGRDRKRLYSAMVHKYSVGVLDDAERQQLKGYLSFVLYIEPDFFERLTTKYSKEVIDAIMA